LLDKLKFWVGLTDKQWFNYLASLQPDEVNFWQPGGTTNFRVLQPGELFLFKLHAPDNYIVGGGWFVSHSFLPLSRAWEAFAEKNGAPNHEQLRTKILAYRRDMAIPDPTIGCIILAKPFFFRPDEWIKTPSDWSPNIVQGKTYSLDNPTGHALWKEVTLRLNTIEAQPIEGQEHELLVKTSALYGQEYLAKARLGQGAFRVLVTDAYNRRCAITGERTLPVLEAAHIKPYVNEGPHHIDNGLLLRSDLHKLYDRGYLTINPDFQVEVGRRIKEEFENGRDYYALHGQPLTNLPDNSAWRPAREFIEWHNENVFLW